MRELELIDVLINVFSDFDEKDDVWISNAIFRNLFTGNNPQGPAPYRIELIQTFISSAVSVGCVSALNAAAVWMQVKRTREMLKMQNSVN